MRDEELENLAKRCEAASKSSRAMNDRIHDAIPDLVAYDFTDSIDGAMTLIPERFSIMSIEEMPKGWIVKLMSRTNDRAPIMWSEGKTLPGSICAAALRSLASITTGEK